MEELEPEWHLCEVAEDVKLGFKDGKCTYKTKNRDAMRVHLRTLHQVYYCGYCRQRWYGAMGQKQMWKRHMEKDCRQHPEIRGVK